MEDNLLLEEAARLMLERHRRQVDKAGHAYFLHPMRVALHCHTAAQKAVAFMHDLIEDTGITADELLALGFPEEVVGGVVAMTRQEGESYEDFVARCGRHPIARIVKLHDIEDNLNVMRLDQVSEKDTRRLNRYLAARRYLLTLTSNPQ